MSRHPWKSKAPLPGILPSGFFLDLFTRTQPNEREFRSSDNRVHVHEKRQIKIIR
jgi:hypothetical protein